MKYIVVTTENFDKWLKKVRDLIAKAKILKRLRMLTLGNFGDYKNLGEGISELRFHKSKGYRIYYSIKSDKVVLLIGGIKDSQKNDIKKAKEILQLINKKEVAK